MGDGEVRWVWIRVEGARPVEWPPGIFRSHWARREGGEEMEEEEPDPRGKRGGR